MTNMINIDAILDDIAIEEKNPEQTGYCGLPMEDAPSGMYLCKMDLDRPCRFPHDYYIMENTTRGTIEYLFPDTEPGTMAALSALAEKL